MCVSASDTLSYANECVSVHHLEVGDLLRALAEEVGQDILPLQRIPNQHITANSQSHDSQQLFTRCVLNKHTPVY
jgi:hypothetical protein